MKNSSYKKVDDLYKLIDQLNIKLNFIEKMLLYNHFPKKTNRKNNSLYNLSKFLPERKYQLKDQSNDFKIPRASFGILYNNKQIKYLDRIIDALKKASSKNKFNFICFTINDIDLESKTVNGKFVSADIKDGVKVSLPSIIYNIAYHSNLSSIKCMRQLKSLKGMKVVNPVNRFNQSVIFDVISSLPQSDSTILPFKPLTYSSLAEFTSKYTSLFLIPETGIFNNKNIIIEKDIQNNLVAYNVVIGEKQMNCSEMDLYRTIKSMIQDKNYLVMKGVNTLKWNGMPLEARVYSQKNSTGKWSITEMISINESFSFGSIYKKSTDRLIKTLLDIAPEKLDEIELKLSNNTLNTCAYLDYFLSNLGSCYIDYIIDENGCPYIVYFGGFDQKNFLMRQENNESFDKYIKNLMEYLFYLQNDSLNKEKYYDMG